MAAAISDLGSKKTKISIEAALWVGSEDFYDVCEMAGLNGETLLHMLRAIMREPSRIRREYLARKICRFISAGGADQWLYKELDIKKPWTKDI